MGRPGDGRVRVGAKKLPVLAIEYVEETVLGRLQEDLPHLAIHLHVGQSHILNGRIVPIVSGRGLVMPFHFARIGIHGDNGGKKEVVSSARGADRSDPGRTVSHTEIDDIEVGVIDDGIPYGATASDFPPISTLPGLRRLLKLGMFKGERGVARYGKEAPDHFSSLGVVGAHIATNTELGTAIANEDFSVGGPRRSRDGIEAVAINDCIDFPDLFAAQGIECDQSSIEATDVNASFVDGDSPVHHITAGSASELAGNLGIVGPEAFTRDRVDCKNPTPGTGEVHDAVHHNGR